MWRLGGLVADVVEKYGGDVALTVVAGNGDDGFAAVFFQRSKPQGSVDIGTGGDAAKDAFFGSEFAGGLNGIFVGDGVDIIKYFAVQDVGDEVGAETLNLMGASLAGGEQGGCFWFHTVDFH